MAGLPCPNCGTETGVSDSRPSTFEGAPTTRRRRVCDKCGNRFTTYEIAADFAGIRKNIAKEVIQKLLSEYL